MNDSFTQSLATPTPEHAALIDAVRRFVLLAEERKLGSANLASIVTDMNNALHPFNPKDGKFAEAERAAQKCSGAELILTERCRQIHCEGWDAYHDDSHDKAELLEAAMAYGRLALMCQDKRINPAILNDFTGEVVGWPWASGWKPSDNVTVHLIKMGALVAAEIDRLERAKNVSTSHVLSKAV